MVSKRRNPRGSASTLALVLGDQLDPSSLERMKLDRQHDAVLMVEVKEASTAPLSHVQRTILVLSAMRHFARKAREGGYRVRYISLSDAENTQSFEGEINRAIRELTPERLVCVHPGAHRLHTLLEDIAHDHDIELEILPDEHFTCSLDRFERWASGRKQLTMEYFYREQRKRLGVLVGPDGEPEDGQWNYDKQNRKAFKGAPNPPDRPTHSVDAITRGVIDDVREHLPDLPGKSEAFNRAVTRRQALVDLRDFVEHRLAKFGNYQDAMWEGRPMLYHSLLSASLNLKLLRPMEVVEAACEAYEKGAAPLNCAEGFVRQIIGWREFIRGVYWQQGDDYESRNALGHTGSLPEFYWNADTDMNCMRDAIGSVVDHAYGHHIARLMVTGNFALIAGIDPGAVNDWYLGMYADGFEWVTAPNTIGMALHADGGVVGTKPYAASGKYIQRMSNYCKNCRYSVSKRSGEDACPFNVFYWEFLHRHRKRFKGNNRMNMMLKNLDRIDKDEMVQITTSAKSLRSRFGIVD